MNKNIDLYKNIINTICDKIIIKIKKYYSKTESKNDMLQNLMIILNFTDKLNIYKL